MEGEALFHLLQRGVHAPFCAAPNVARMPLCNQKRDCWVNCQVANLPYIWDLAALLSSVKGSNRRRPLRLEANGNGP